MTPTEGPNRPSSTSAGHLLWAVPVAFAGSAVLWLGAMWGWCGDDIGGCRGDAASTIESIALIVIVLLVAGVWATGILFVAPWTGPGRRRLVVAGVAGAVVVASGLIYLALA